VTGKSLLTGCSGESGSEFFAASTSLGGETRIRGASMTVGGEEKVYTRLLFLLCLQSTSTEVYNLQDRINTI